MKLWLRRALGIMLCAVMLFSLLPAGAARAEEDLTMEEITDEDLIEILDETEDDEIVIVDEDGTPIGESGTGDLAAGPEGGKSGFGYDCLHIEPLYRSVISEEQLAERLDIISAAAASLETEELSNSTYCSTLSAAATYMKGQMINRYETITFTMPYSVASQYSSIFYAVYDKAVEHTENCSGREGDALKWGNIGWGGSASYVYYNDTDCWEITFTFDWTTTSSQESSLTSKVNSAMSSLSLSGKTETQKIRAIHDYICDNVDYDYEHVDQGSEYPLQFSAYAAMCQGTAVCQGYAVLFYRMAKEAGLGVRVITSNSHAWNIVRIGSVYYNIDTTWDGQDTTTYYTWYLKGMREFSAYHHIREEPFYSDEFEAAFPMVKDSKLNADNPYYTFTSVDGSSVPTNASSKPKVLIFGSCSIYDLTNDLVEPFLDYDLSGVNLVVVDTLQKSKAEVKEYRDAIAGTNARFCYDEGYDANSAMWDYLEQAGYWDSVMYPVIIFIDTNNQVQNFRVGPQGAGNMAKLVKDFLGVTLSYGAPRIKAQPSSKTVSGGQVSFTAEGVGRGTISYQWYFRKSASDSWTKCSTGGYNTQTYSVEATSGRNGYQYRCAVKNAYGTTYTNTVSLTVMNKPTISTQPGSVTTALGNTAKFTVKASGDSLSYQWYFRKTSSDSWSACSTGGAKTSTLTVTAEAYRTGYQYRCKVSNPVGYVYTNAVTLTVTGIAKPAITSSPSSVTKTEGETAKFTVAASGNGLSYQWYYRTSSSGSWNASTASSAKSATLSITAETHRDGYQYRCKVSNSSGYVYSGAATLTVKPIVKPTITTQPSSVTTTLGSTAKFTVKASGNPLNYQWYYRTSSSGSWNKCSSGGYNTATYTVEATDARDGYQYRCTVKNSAGSVTSNTVTLKLNAYEKPSITSQPSSVTAGSGDTVKFTVKATGGSLSYQWYYRTSSSASWSKCSGTGYNTPTYSVEATSGRNGYQYYCKVSNSYGSVTSKTVTLTYSSVTYRALLIGEVNFSWETANRNRGDVELIRDALANVTGPSGGKYSVTCRYDLSNEGIHSAIQSAFAGADSTDVSLFFLATHGVVDVETGPYAGELVTIESPGSTDGYLTLGELAGWLKDVPGKIIVVLGSCGSGAAIIENGNARFVADVSGESDEAFSEAVIRAFAEADEFLPEDGAAAPNTGEFRSSKFYVMTAAAHQESSWGQEGSMPYNYFPYYFAAGFNTGKPADANGNGTITMIELFNYVYENALGPYNGYAYQHAQMYPEGSTYALFK